MTNHPNRLSPQAFTHVANRLGWYVDFEGWRFLEVRRTGGSWIDGLTFNGKPLLRETLDHLRATTEQRNGAEKIGFIMGSPL